MSFVLEVDMYSTVLRQLPSLLGLETDYAYATEVPLSYRIADVGFVALSSIDLNTYEARSLAKLDLRQIWALAYTVCNERVSTAQLSAMLSSAYRNSELDEVIAALSDGGLLEKDGEEFFIPGQWLGSQSGSVIFVELKLSRWKEALRQAAFYRSKADLSCVVLDGDLAHGVDRQYFISKGIGLFATWPGQVETLVHPKRNTGTSALQRNFNRLRAIRDLTGTQPGKWKLATRAMEVA